MRNPSARGQQSRHFQLVVAGVHVREHLLRGLFADYLLVVELLAKLDHVVGGGAAQAEFFAPLFVDRRIAAKHLRIDARFRTPHFLHEFVRGGNTQLIEHEIRGSVIGEDDHQVDGVAQ